MEVEKKERRQGVTPIKQNKKIKIKERRERK